MAFLIKNCQLMGTGRKTDLRLRKDLIEEIGENLSETHTETLIDAGGGLLLPGLHDHHIHLVSLAASLASIQCGPPHVETAEQFASVLQGENSKSTKWLRGIGYHDCVAGDIDRFWLDQHIPDRPARIQHRGGRLWVLNSPALESLGLIGSTPPTNTPSGVEHEGAIATGRLYECDRWIRAQLNSTFPCLADVSQLLASYGIIGITDTTPSNGQDEWRYFSESQSSGELKQKVRMMGGAALPRDTDTENLQVGEFKIQLLESQLPEFDEVVRQIRLARKSGRNVAVHCVTHTELVFTLSCLEVAGVRPGDRIEHASVAFPETLARIKEMGLRVISQPHFILERGEQYLRDVDPIDQASLYRLRSFLDADVPLAAGSDAPFGSANPWHAMAAAVSRQTIRGSVIGSEEALTPEMALALFTSCPENPGLEQRTIAPGQAASLCLLETPWKQARENLAETEVTATWVGGRLVYRKD